MTQEQKHLGLDPAFVEEAFARLRRYAVKMYGSEVCKNGHPLLEDSIKVLQKTPRVRVGCKLCKKTYSREYMRKTARERRSKLIFWGRVSQYRKFGITVEEYERMLVEQNGRCAICGSSESVKHTKDGESKRRLSVDHCHTTGKVRGLLCAYCNFGIGSFKDNPEALIKAAAYLNANK